MQIEESIRQDWSRLHHGDCVTVAEFGQRPYPAIVDEFTEDMKVIWVLPESGAGRRVFGYHDDVVIVIGKRT
jgi:hypothetical protein